MLQIVQFFSHSFSLKNFKKLNIVRHKCSTISLTLFSAEPVLDDVKFGTKHKSAMKLKNLMNLAKALLYPQFLVQLSSDSLRRTKLIESVLSTFITRFRPRKSSLDLIWMWLNWKVKLFIRPGNLWVRKGSSEFQNFLKKENLLRSWWKYYMRKCKIAFWVRRNLIVNYIFWSTMLSFCILIGNEIIVFF